MNLLRLGSQKYVYADTKPNMEYKKEISIRECDEVYPPAEDTFLLLECLEVEERSKVLEMGCGTGLISCHISQNGAELTAADVNPKAVECTKRNLITNGLKGKVLLSDMFQNITGVFDTMVFNPPYLSEEEKEERMIEKAWAGGPTGTEVLSKFLEGSKNHLSANGKIIVLLSSEMNKKTLDEILSDFKRTRLGTRRCFFEELWVEELEPSSRHQ